MRTTPNPVHPRDAVIASSRTEHSPLAQAMRHRLARVLCVLTAATLAVGIGACAKEHGLKGQVGQTVEVQAPVAKVFALKNGNTVLLLGGPKYVHQEVSVLIPAAVVRELGEVKQLNRAEISARGRVELFRGHPEIRIATAADLKIVKPATYDLELSDIDLTGWAGLKDPAGAPRSEAERERNLQKNRPYVSTAGMHPPDLDTASFLELVRGYDQKLGIHPGENRKDLTHQQKKTLAEMEDHIVSLTGWLVVTYPGPPELTNDDCVRYHDWHLELLAEPIDHGPGIGDPTAIIAEITPRTEGPIYRSGIRLQKLAEFVRLLDQSDKATGNPPHRVRVTGYLMWDDSHTKDNLDIGPTIKYFTPKDGYYHPWRRTAWEVHPVMKVEDLGPADCGGGAGPCPPPSASAAEKAPQ